MMEFSEAQLKEFMKACRIIDGCGIRQQQQAWEQKDKIGGFVKTAIRFLALGAATHPGVHASTQVVLNDYDIEKVRKDWQRIERFVNFYFEVFKDTLVNLEKAKERENGK